MDKVMAPTGPLQLGRLLEAPVRGEANSRVSKIMHPCKRKASGIGSGIYRWLHIAERLRSRNSTLSRAVGMRTHVASRFKSRIVQV